MQRYNLTFGELNYDGSWTRLLPITFLEKKTTITIIVDGDEAGDFDDNQYRAYQMYLLHWSSIQYRLLDSVIAYYQQRRLELGYDIQENEDYLHIQTVADIIPMITLDSMIIPYGDLHPERDVGLLFHCTIIRNDT